MQKILTFILLLFTVIPLVSAQDHVDPAELADEDGQFAEINGAQIYYIERGVDNDSAIILIHGFGGSTFTWRDNIDVLVDAGFHVVALDLPPFGLSDKSADIDYSRDAMADTVAGLMEALGIESATVVGHSMGGGVTAYFAVQYNEHVDSLVFVAGGAGYSGEDHESESDEEQSDSSPLGFLSRFDPESPLAAGALRLFLTPERFNDILITAYHNTSVVTPEVEAGYQRALQVEGWEIGLLAFMGTGEEIAPFGNEALATLDVPVLIVWGEEDSWAPIIIGEYLRDLMQNVTWVTYPDVGHLPMEENTAKFNEDLLEFLTSD